MAVPIVGMLVGFVIILPLVLLVGAVLLRAAVAWYNRLTVDRMAALERPPESHSGFAPNLTTRGPQTDPSNPFASPASYSSAPPPTRGVPEPGYLYAGVIIIAMNLANLPVTIGVAMLSPQAAGSPVNAVLSLLSLPIHFLIGAAVLKWMLPTRTFGAAVLICLLLFAICVIIAVVILMVVLVLGVVFYMAARA